MNTNPMDEKVEYWVDYGKIIIPMVNGCCSTITMF